MKKSKLAIAVALAFSLSACGGGGSDTSTPSPDVDKPTPSPEVLPTEKANDFSVTAIDGYLQGALVCLDINENAKCDVDSEPYDNQGDALGKYNLAIPTDIDPDNYKVLVEVIAGKTIDMDTPEVDGKRAPESKAYTMTAPKGQDTVTPMTTIVEHKIAQNPTLSITAATEEVKEDLGLPEETTVEDLLGDYIKTTTGTVDDKPKDMLIRTIAKKLVETEGLLDALKTQSTDQKIVDTVTKQLDTVLAVMKQSKVQIQAQAEAENEIRKTQVAALIAQANARTAEAEAKAAQAKLDEIEAELVLATAEEKLALQTQKIAALEAKILKDIEKAEKKALIEQAKLASEQAAAILLAAEETAKEKEAAEKLRVEALLAIEEAANEEAQRLAQAALDAAQEEINKAAEAEALKAIEAAERLAIEEAARLETERQLEAAAEEAARLAQIVKEEAQAEKLAAEVAEAARLEAERLAAIEAARLEAERLAAEEAARLEAERIAAEEAARLEAERLAAEEAARLEAERLAAEEAARLEAERLAAEEAARLEAERLAAEEAARLEAERRAAEEAARIEAERLAAEEAARLEAERLAAEEAARLEAERIAAEEAARLAAEQANYGTCMASLDDADYDRQVGDKIEYNLQRYSIGSQSAGNSVQINTYLGAGFAWSRDFSHITDMPEWYVNYNGNLQAEQWSWYDKDGNIDSSTENSYFSNDEIYRYYGYESINSGDYSYGGIKSISANFNLANHEMLLNQEFSAVSQGTSLSTIAAVTESTPLSELEHVNYAHTYEYLGKEVITVPAGTFTACKVRTSDRVMNDDGSVGEADVQLAWYVNRGVIKQEQYNPSWSIISHRQAFSLPAFGEYQPAIEPLVIGDDLFTDNQLAICVQDALNLHKVDDLSKLETLICHDKGIASTNGLELLTGLKTLDLSANQIVEVDVSANTDLTFLNLRKNPIGYLDVSANDKLIFIDLRNSAITAEDIVGDTHDIAYVDFIVPSALFTDNNFKQCVQHDIDNSTNKISSLSDLKYLNCYDKPVLDSSGVELLTGLVHLYIQNSQLSSIDLSKNIELTKLDLHGSQLTELDLSKNILLETVNLNNSLIGSLDIIQNTLLTSLDLRNNPISTLDISANLRLSELNLIGTQVSVDSITGDENDIAYFGFTVPDGVFTDDILKQCVQESANNSYEIIYSLTDINRLFCYEGIENTIGLELLTGLKSLDLYQGRFTSIDISRNTQLLDLELRNGSLIEIDVSNNLKLRHLVLKGNPISELDVTANTSLFELDLRTTNISDQTLIGDINNAAYYGFMVPDVFADENFKLCVQNEIDRSYSIVRSLTELTYLNCYGDPVKSVAGLELLTNLEILGLTNFQLDSINLSENKALTRLTLQDNQLTDIDLSANTLLQTVNLARNPLISVDISNNTQLTSIDLRGTEVTAESLIGDVNNVAIKDFILPEGLFTDKNFEQCVQESINQQNNNVRSLSDVTHLACYNDVADTTGLEQLTGLTDLTLYNSSLTSIDLSAIAVLTSLTIDRAQLANIDLSANTALTRLSLVGNQLTELDLSANTLLTNASLKNNLISALDISTNTQLVDINLVGTSVTKGTLIGDINNAAYFGFIIPEEVFTDTNFSTCVQQSVDNSYQKIRSLADLSDVDCYNGTIENLQGLDSLTGLTSLLVRFTQLTSIDLTANTLLTRLDLNANQLTQLDLSANTQLTYLQLTGNQLTEIDLSANTELDSLYLGDNPISTLNITANTKLSELTLESTNVTPDTLIGDINNVAIFE